MMTSYEKKQRFLRWLSDVFHVIGGLTILIVWFWTFLTKYPMSPGELLGLLVGSFIIGSALISIGKLIDLFVDDL